ncbi:MAG TPA: hypothetical protein VFE05_06985 [Longimicrobiaceae bacterium]|jgi:hypothetical protein|nr:hypothetical protein [Longimicrobiaceae bacterium]
MPKLKLNPDLLAVESFDVAPARREGTPAAEIWPQVPIPTGWGDTCVFLGPCGTN